jgi:hypothetical protein
MEGKLTLAAISAEKDTEIRYYRLDRRSREWNNSKQSSLIIFRLWQALIDAFGYPTLKIGSGGSEA